MITIALPKGALLNDSISIFKKAGLNFSDALLENNRSNRTHKISYSFLLK